MVKECRDDQIRNPATNRCVLRSSKQGRLLVAAAAPVRQNKVCKDNEILNPATNRCVSKTGKIGRELLARPAPHAPARPAPDPPLRAHASPKNKCKDNEILDPATKKCVKKSSKLGQELLLAKYKNLQIYSKIYFVNGSAHSFVLIEGSIDKEKVLTQFHEDNIVFVKYDTVQELVKEFRAAARKIKDSGYRVERAEGQSFDDIQKLLDNFDLCKRNLNIKSPHGKKCVNDSTLIMMDPIKDVSKEDIVQMSDGYCYDINEIADYCEGVKMFKNPFTSNGLSNKDIELLKSHPKLKPATKARIAALQKSLADEQTSIVRLQKKSPEVFMTFFNIFVLTSLTCVSDYTEDFKHAQLMLTKLSEELDKFAKADKETILAMRSTRGVTFSSVMESYGSTCIHGIGHKLCDIMFNSLNVLLANNIKYESPFFIKVGERDFVFTHFTYDKVHFYICLYTPIYNTLRLGSVIVRDLINDNSTVAITWKQSQDAYNKMVKPFIKDVKSRVIQLPLLVDVAEIRDLVCFDLIEMSEMSIKKVDFKKNIVIVSGTGENKKGTVFPIEYIDAFIKDWKTGNSGDVLYECTDPKPRGGYDWKVVRKKPVIKLPLCNGTFYVSWGELSRLLKKKIAILGVGERIAKFKKTISDRAMVAYIHHVGDIVGANHCQEGTEIEVYSISDVSSEYVAGR